MDIAKSPKPRPAFNDITWCGNHCHGQQKSLRSRWKRSEAPSSCYHSLRKTEVDVRVSKLRSWYLPHLKPFLHRLCLLPLLIGLVLSVSPTHGECLSFFLQRSCISVFRYSVDYPLWLPFLSSRRSERLQSVHFPTRRPFKEPRARATQRRAMEKRTTSTAEDLDSGPP